MGIKSGDIMDALRLTIRRKREEMGLTEYDLSRKAKVDPRTIYNFENREGDMKVESLTRLLAVLDVKLWQIDIYKRFSTCKEFVDFVKREYQAGYTGSETAEKLDMSLTDLRILYGKAFFELDQERSK